MTETVRPVCAAHVASRGPRFFRTLHGGDVMFEITLDHRSKIGPRPATEADSLAYPAAWEAFAAGEKPKDEPGEPMVQFKDHPDAKAEHEHAAAERQKKMDAKRGGGL